MFDFLKPQGMPNICPRGNSTTCLFRHFIFWPSDGLPSGLYPDSVGIFCATAGDNHRDDEELEGANVLRQRLFPKIVCAGSAGQRGGSTVRGARARTVKTSTSISDAARTARFRVLSMRQRAVHAPDASAGEKPIVIPAVNQLNCWHTTVRSSNRSPGSG